MYTLYRDTLIGGVNTSQTTEETPTITSWKEELELTTNTLSQISFLKRQTEKLDFVLLLCHFTLNDPLFAFPIAVLRPCTTTTSSAAAGHSVRRRSRRSGPDRAKCPEMTFSLRMTTKEHLSSTNNLLCSPSAASLPGCIWLEGKRSGTN